MRLALVFPLALLTTIVAACGSGKSTTSTSTGTTGTGGHGGQPGTTSASSGGAGGVGGQGAGGGMLDSGIMDAGDAGDAADAPEVGPLDLCTNTGGTETMAPCCAGAGDFPSTCALGTCGCPPDSSVMVKICNCPPMHCYSPGNGCIFHP